MKGIVFSFQTGPLLQYYIVFLGLDRSLISFPALHTTLMDWSTAGRLNHYNILRILQQPIGYLKVHVLGPNEGHCI